MMKRRWLLALPMLITLQACNDDLTAIQQFIADVHANTTARIPPIPKAKTFEHIPYKSANGRSPFAEMKAEALQDNISASQDCLSPDPKRIREPLEKYALDNLTMRGTLGDSDDVWALVEATDGSLHRVRKNNYLGLFHGRILRVDANQIEAVELIPDGAGCWKERKTQLQMLDPRGSARN